MDVITPAVGDGAGEAEANTTAFGEPKLARLNTLNISMRNWRCTFSVSAVSFKSERSVSAIPGPISVFRPTLP